MINGKALLREGMNLIKSCWLSVGLGIFCLILIEGVSWGYIFSREWYLAKKGDPRQAADTYFNAPWVADYYREFHLSSEVIWQPYVYWRRKEFSGQHINVDADGIRKSKPYLGNTFRGQSKKQIFLLGGSTMWGTGARDDYTIPSLLANELANSGVNIAVTNLGESGYVSTQEVVTLLIKLKRGEIPDVVIFYDGVNDTFSAYQQQSAGLPQNEFNRVREFNILQSGRSNERARLISRTFIQSLGTAQILSRILNRYKNWKNNLAVEREESAKYEILADEVLQSYRSNIEIVKALGRHYGFRYLFYWQPTIFDKNKLTKYEASLKSDEIRIAPFYQITNSAIRASGLEEDPENCFRDLSRALTDVDEPLFIDWMHLGESGNAIIAKQMADDLSRILSK